MVCRLINFVSLDYRLSENLEAHNFVLYNYPNKITNEKGIKDREKKKGEDTERKPEREGE